MGHHFFMARGLLPVIACALLVSSCASGVPPEWKGQSRDHLLQLWGAPNSSARTSDRGEVLTYRQEGEYYCTVTFTVDATGIIQRVNWGGNVGGCQALIGSRPAP